MKVTFQVLLLKIENLQFFGQNRGIVGNEAVFWQFCSKTSVRPKRIFYRNTETYRNRNINTETELTETETIPKFLFI